MTDAELLYSVILAAIAGIFSIFVCTTRRGALALLAFVQLSFWMRWSFAYLNAVLKFWAQKDLSDMSLNLIDSPDGIWGLFVNKLSSYAAGASSLQGIKFFIEAVVSLPALRLLEESTSMLILTNAFVGTISGVVAYYYLKKIFDDRVGTVGFLLASLYPASVNFSFFALRDEFLYFFLIVNILSFMSATLCKEGRGLHWSIYGVSLFCALCLRLALLPFLGLLPGWLILQWMRRTLARFHIVQEKMFVITVVAFVTPAILAGTLFVGYAVVLRQIGYAEIVSPDEILQQYTMNRYNRGFSSDQQGNGQVLVAGSGNGSDVLPPALYKSVPLPVRLIVQIIGMWAVPMPWLLTGLSRMLGFTDSVFVGTLMFWALGAHRLIKTGGRGCLPHQFESVGRYPKQYTQSISYALLFTFFALMIGFGLLVSNSGNAFRMRLCVVPYIIPGASIFFAATYAWIGGRFVRTAEKRKKARTKKRKTMPGFVPAGGAPVSSGS